MDRINAISLWIKKYLKIYWDTAADIFLIVVTTVLGSIFKWIGYKIHNTEFTFLDFFKDGTFVMYAFSFLISTYTIYNYQVKGTNSKNLPKIILPFIIILSLIFSELDKSKTDSKTDADFIYLVSIIPFIISLLLFYVAQLRYNKDNRVVDVGEQSREAISRLGNSLS